MKTPRAVSINSSSMISSPSVQRGHSADVSMRLLVNGASLPIAQMGPDFLLLDAAGSAHPPGDASILLRVDASERRWEVRLPEGITAGGAQRVSIASRE